MITKFLLLSYLSSGQNTILAHCSHCSCWLQISYLWCSFHILTFFHLIVHSHLLAMEYVRDSVDFACLLWISIMDLYSSSGNLRVFYLPGTWFIHIICILLTFRASISLLLSFLNSYYYMSSSLLKERTIFTKISLLHDFKPSLQTLPKFILYICLGIDKIVFLITSASISKMISFPSSFTTMLIFQISFQVLFSNNLETSFQITS